MRTLICQFQPIFLSSGESRSGTCDRHYHYAYVGPKQVKRGDWALVHNGTNFGVVEIKRVIPGIDPSVTKHVIEVLTQAEFEAYKERNEKIEETRATMDELNYRLKQHRQLDKYKELAKTDVRAAELLQQVAETLGIKLEQIEAPAASQPETTN